MGDAWKWITKWKRDFDYQKSPGKHCGPNSIFSTQSWTFCKQAQHSLNDVLCAVAYIAILIMILKRKEKNTPYSMWLSKVPQALPVYTSPVPFGPKTLRYFEGKFLWGITISLEERAGEVMNKKYGGSSKALCILSTWLALFQPRQVKILESCSRAFFRGWGVKKAADGHKRTKSNRSFL